MSLLSEGGPGSGVGYRNTCEIDMPLSEYISVGTRKGLLQNADYEEHEIPLDMITRVAQKSYVPHKLDRMIDKKEVVTAAPIDVLWVKGDGYHLVDGHHRYLAAKQLGIPTLVARVYRKSEKTMPDHKRHDAETNYQQPEESNWTNMSEALSLMESGDINACHEALFDIFSKKTPEEDMTAYSMGDKIALSEILDGDLDSDGSISWESEVGKSVLRFHEDGRIAELQDETGVYRDKEAYDRLAKVSS